jgi:hypothetical protein
MTEHDCERVSENGGYGFERNLDDAATPPVWPYS